MSFYSDIRKYQIVSREAKADHETGISAEKTMDSLMYHMMREDTSDDKKKQAMLSAVEGYVESRGIDNEYMMSFSKKLMGLAKALLSHYSEKEPEEEEPKSEGEEATSKTLPQKGSPEWHQHKIAVDTVRNPAKGLLSGPSAEEAKEILKTKFKYSDAEIKALEK